MSQSESDGVEDVVMGQGRLLAGATGTAMTAAARALAQRTRAKREQEQQALADARARAEADRRLLLLRLELARTESWRTGASLQESADTLHLARLYSSVEPTAAAAVPGLEEHIRTRWERDPDDVLAERARRLQDAREADAVLYAARGTGAVAPGADSTSVRHLLIDKPGYEDRGTPLQEAAPGWEGFLQTPERARGVNSAVAAWEAALPHVDDHPGPARVAVLAEEKLRSLYPEVLAEFDALRLSVGAAQALSEIAPRLRYADYTAQDRERYAALLAPDEGRSVDMATATTAWAATTQLSRGADVPQEQQVARARAQERLQELAPQVMDRFAQAREANPVAATDAAVAELRTLSATSPVVSAATPAAGAAGASPGTDAERGETAPTLTSAQRHARRSMYAHDVGASTEKASTPGAVRDQGLAERALEQQRRRAAQRRPEGPGRDRGGHSQ